MSVGELDLAPLVAYENARHLNRGQLGLIDGRLPSLVDVEG